MQVKSAAIRLSTGGKQDAHDITSQVQDLVTSSGVRNGTVTVFCPSSTSGLTTIEFEPGCIADLHRLFNEIIPEEREYAHNRRWEDGNGHSHVRSALLGASLTIPVVDGMLALGTWQQIVHLDFDVRPRQRELVLQIMGD